MTQFDEKLNTAVTPSAARPSLFWTGYLLGAIVLVGAPGCTLVVPFILVGRWLRRLELQAGRVGCTLIRIMFNLNIWFKQDVRLRLPYAIGRSNNAAIVVANHRSNLDVFFLISYIPNVRILAKRALFFLPFLGFMMWAMRQIPVTRGKLTSYLQAVEAARRGLRKGDPIVFFPEGRRCKQGLVGTQKFYPAAFTLAKDENVPVYPVVFCGTDKVWPRGSFGMAAGHTAHVTSLDPLMPEDFASAQEMLAECQLRINLYIEEYAGGR